MQGSLRAPQPCQRGAPPRSPCGWMELRGCPVGDPAAVGVSYWCPRGPGAPSGTLTAVFCLLCPHRSAPCITGLAV